MTSLFAEENCKCVNEEPLAHGHKSDSTQGDLGLHVSAAGEDAESFEVGWCFLRRQWSLG